MHEQELATGDLAPGYRHWTSDDARSLWAVRVLDAWALWNSGFAFKSYTDPDDCDCVEPWNRGSVAAQHERQKR